MLPQHPGIDTIARRGGLGAQAECMLILAGETPAFGG